MKDSWTVETERMTATLVNEPIQLPQRTALQYAGAREEIPKVPTYILLTRRGGGDPVRIEGEDAELLMWMLMKLRNGPMRIPPQHGDFGLVPGP